MGLLSSLLGSAGVDVGGGGILGQLGNGLSQNSGALLGFASGGPEGMVQGRRSDMLAAAQRQEQEDKAHRIAAAMKVAPQYGIDPEIAKNDPEAAYRMIQFKIQKDQQDRAYGLQASEAARQADQWKQEFGLRNEALHQKEAPTWQTITQKDPNGGPDSTYFYNPKDPSKLVPAPFNGQASSPQNPYAAGGKMSEGESAAATYADRMAKSHSTLTNLESTQSDTTENARGNFPVIGNQIASEKFQQADQAQRDFVNAILRRESGAAISPTEFENARKQYFPQPGDGPKVIEQKRTNRITAIQGIMRGAGRGYKPPEGWEDPSKAGQKQPSQAAQIGNAIAKGTTKSGIGWSAN